MDRMNGHANTVRRARLAEFPPYENRPHPSEVVQPANRPRKAAGKRKQASARFREMNAFVDFTMADLSRAELATWFVLFRDARDGTAQTAVEVIAKRAGTSKQHTLKAIASLVGRGLLERVRIGGINRGASIYRIHALTPGASITGHP